MLHFLDAVAADPADPALARIGSAGPAPM